MKFGIDLDGVFVRFDIKVAEIANKLWPGKLPWDYVPQDWNYTGVLSTDDWDKIWVEIKQTPNFWGTLRGYVENVHALQGFFNYNPSFDAYFITSRVETVGDSPLAQSFQWLQERYLAPRNGHSAVIAVSDAKMKASVIQALKIPYFLDDYAPTVEQLNNLEGFRPHAMVLDRPWNRYATSLPRVYSVAEYLKIVKAA
jgi:hypothetical protein